MTDNEKHTDRRKTATLIDPKLLQVFIPLVLAAGSGFLVHDRSISTLEATVKQQGELLTTYVDSQTNHALTIRELQKDIEAIKIKLSEVGDDQKRIEEINQDLHQLAASLEQRIRFSDEQIQDFKTRIRNLERQLDKL